MKELCHNRYKKNVCYFLSIPFTCLLSLILSSCAPTNTVLLNRPYSTRVINHLSKAYKCTIISKEVVQVEGSAESGQLQGSIVGALAGAALGAGESSDAAVAGAILGGVGGSAIGGTLSKKTTRTAIQYTIECDNLDEPLMSIIQGVEPLMNVGDKAILNIYNSGESTLKPLKTNKK